MHSRKFQVSITARWMDGLVWTHNPWIVNPSAYLHSHSAYSHTLTHIHTHTNAHTLTHTPTHTLTFQFIVWDTQKIYIKLSFCHFNETYAIIQILLLTWALLFLFATSFILFLFNSSFLQALDSLVNLMLHSVWKLCDTAQKQWFPTISWAGYRKYCINHFSLSC